MGEALMVSNSPEYQREKNRADLPGAQIKERTNAWARQTTESPIRPSGPAIPRDAANMQDRYTFRVAAAAN
jgi:hypothetical protein